MSHLISISATIVENASHLSEVVSKAEPTASATVIEHVVCDYGNKQGTCTVAVDLIQPTQTRSATTVSTGPVAFESIMLAGGSGSSSGSSPTTSSGAGKIVASGVASGIGALVGAFLLL